MRRRLACLIMGLSLGASGASAQVVLQSASSDQRQAGFHLEGGHVEIGVADPKNADAAALLGADLSLGTFLAPWLDLSGGVRYWSANIDRSAFGSGVDGKLRDLGLHVDLNYNLLRLLGVRPFLTAGLAGHWVSADVPRDRSLQDALAGFNVGVDGGLGFATVRPGVGLRATARRNFVEDVGHWAFTIGVGWWPHTRAQRAPWLRIAPAAQTGYTVPTALSPALSPAPPAAASPAADGGVDPEIARLAHAISEIVAENRLLRAEVDSLRKAVSAPAPPASPPGAGQVAPSPSRPRLASGDVAVAGTGTPPAEDLRQALDRLALSSGRAGAVHESEAGLVLDLDRSLLFAPGSDDLQVGAQEELRRLAVLLLRFPDVTLTVDGYTDSSGDPARNQRLSRQRALAVAHELARLGVPEERISAVGHGQDRPVASNATAEGRAQNRRVEIVLRAQTFAGGR